MGGTAAERLGRHGGILHASQREVLNRRVTAKPKMKSWVLAGIIARAGLKQVKLNLISRFDFDNVTQGVETVPWRTRNEIRWIGFGIEIVEGVDLRVIFDPSVDDVDVQDRIVVGIDKHDVESGKGLAHHLGTIGSNLIAKIVGGI
ncbi:MAG: hypothetical protein M2R45_00801 [Verrucomicrobia subdivision 3 bacterium]|nr:hypothetical protein [Limisphaerales bacterium]MCS1413094.1 hypothetical protein [Limisphaerales bacterium]